MDQFCYDEYMGIDTDSGYLDYRGLDILKGKVLIPISLPMSNHDALSFEWTTK
jgi:hypothetical protein